jgi:Ca-activated chloride channel family protein
MLKRFLDLPFWLLALAATALAALTLAGLGWQQGGFTSLWLTPDQQGARRFEKNQFESAALRFEDPAWQGIAHYRNGAYAEAAGAFGRLGTAEGFFNRGNAFMKQFEYGKAITAYEQALKEAPDWQLARENLALARHTRDYIEDAREQSSTGKLEADDVVYDNERNRGQEIQVDRESVLEAASAEKWMRSVDTQTADFLRSRFLLEASRRGER